MNLFFKKFGLRLNVGISYFKGQIELSDFQCSLTLQLMQFMVCITFIPY